MNLSVKPTKSLRQQSRFQLVLVHRSTLRLLTFVHRPLKKSPNGLMTSPVQLRAWLGEWKSIEV